MKSKRKGFTIIELVIVVAVIGILTAVLVPTFTNLVQKAQETARQENMRNAFLQFQADAADGSLDANNEVALPDGVTEKDTQMTLDGVDYVYDPATSSWVEGSFVEVPGHGGRGRYLPRDAHADVVSLGAHDIPYDPTLYKLMYVGGNFKGYSSYSDCVVKFLAEIARYAAFIDGAASSTDEYYLAKMAQNENYETYEYNSKVSSSAANGFKVREKGFRVGDDSPFEFMPKLVVIDENGITKDAHFWTDTHPFEVTVEVLNETVYETADPSLYTNLDLAAGTIDFEEAAIGKTIKITSAPTGVSEKRKEKFKQSMVVNVVDGFNVYNAKQLAFLDDRNRTTDATANTDATWVKCDTAIGDMSGDNSIGIGAGNAWMTFKETYFPDIADQRYKNIILQTDISVTRDDIPDFFYYNPDVDQAADLFLGTTDGLNLRGTFKDYVGVYRTVRSEGNETRNLYGNYFHLDYSALDLIKYHPIGKNINSHAQLVYVHTGPFNVEDLNVTGNGRRVLDEDSQETAENLAGSLAFIKMNSKSEDEARKLTVNNVIARNCFMTVHCEINFRSATPVLNGADDGYAYKPAEAYINDCKFTDNYNSFLFSQGTKMFSKNTDYSCCGGAVIIQTHFAHGHWGQKNYGDGTPMPNSDYKTGYWPYSEFDGCLLDNYVAGSEPWFVQYEKTEETSLIKALSNLYSDGGNTFVVRASDKVPSLYAAGEFLFNFIVVNMPMSYGETENEANKSIIDTEGRVVIKNGEKVSDFSFSQPANVDITGMTPEEISAALTAATTNYALIHGAMVAGAPVFQSGNSYAAYDGANQYLQPLANVGSEDWSVKTEMADSDAFFTEASEFTTIYFQGMMLTLQQFSLPTA